MEQKFQQTSSVDYSLKEGETLVLQLKSVSASHFLVNSVLWWVGALTEFSVCFFGVNRQVLKVWSPSFQSREWTTPHLRKRLTKKSPWSLSNHLRLLQDHSHLLRLSWSLPQTCRQIWILRELLNMRPQKPQKMIPNKQMLLQIKAHKIYQMTTLGIFRQLFNRL